MIYRARHKARLLIPLFRRQLAAKIIWRFLYPLQLLPVSPPPLYQIPPILSSYVHCNSLNDP